MGYDVDKYIGFLPKDELSDCVYQRAEAWRTQVGYNGSFSRMQQNYNLYYNNNPDFNLDDSWNGLQITGGNGEYLRVKMNHFRNIITHILNMIFSKLPTGKSKALHNTTEAREAVKLYDSIIEHDLTKKNIKDELRLAGEVSLVMDTGAMLIEWDMMSGDAALSRDDGSFLSKGDLRCRSKTPVEWGTDQTKSNWDDVEWVWIKEYVNRHVLAAQFPDMAEEILNKSKNTIDNYNNSYDLVGSYDVPVYKFYHKPIRGMRDADSGIDLTNGRYCMTMGKDLTLIDMENPYGCIPLFPFRASPRIGSIYGYSVANDLAPIQNLLNAMHSAIATNCVAHGLPNIVGIRGSDITPVELTGGMNYFEVANPQMVPHPLDLLSVSPEMFKYVDMLTKAMETLSAMNSVIRGDPEASLKSGVALNIVQSMGVQFISQFQESIISGYTKILNHILKLYKMYASADRVVTICGEDNKYLVKRWNAEDVSVIDSVVVEPIDPASSTYAGRVTSGQDLLKSGLIKTPQEYLTVVETGNLDPLTQRDTCEMNLIQAENEMISDGKMFSAHPDDNHEQHMLEHFVPIADIDARQNQQIIAAQQAHMRSHINMLAQNQQMQLTQQMTAQQSQGLTQGPPQPMMPPPGGHPALGPPQQAPQNQQPN